MTLLQADAGVSLKNILYLTDFSGPSEAALPFAAAIARGYGAKVHALNVFLPFVWPYTPPGLTAAAVEAEEEVARKEMRQVESQLVGLPHEAVIERGIGIWDAVKAEIETHEIDLLVLGTHGRTGAEKLLLGSVAEEIFRRAPIPVLTIGPGVRSSAHNGGRFNRVLFATDFTADSLAAAPYAVSLARENRAQLVLLHVLRKREPRNGGRNDVSPCSVAEATHLLHKIVPDNGELASRLQAIVDFGNPAERILAVARECRSDLIVLGVRVSAHIGPMTHLERATAHKIVSRAECPVLTVRREE